MKDKSINLVIKCSKSPKDEESNSSKILSLKSKLENKEIELVHLEKLDCLIVNTTLKKWNKLTKEITKSEMGKFEIVENKLT